MSSPVESVVLFHHGFAASCIARFNCELVIFSNFKLLEMKFGFIYGAEVDIDVKVFIPVCHFYIGTVVLLNNLTSSIRNHRHVP